MEKKIPVQGRGGGMFATHPPEPTGVAAVTG